ncbi:adenylyl cyclase beta, putative [Plasmodium berghei]|uniref:Adenylyl cyclase beta, putative n=2 Tax=Plasmodium berghei TaxID=5821 RepID=A0A509AR15_PLABA|nr:adenylyl cyclase beta, putative [Plasmodium berghei ANKA]SCM25280.1 adenylyl cyclase beta, putative [Plasmodium berghei]SCN27320.1 adenylyl cyclase beta, putative [Plasmodium berghei]SCO61946.1 adenylyl cyclase beta, putative [Plasmodium berghei]SCO63745.1 adenylyl cyclase beta, putative [Plasmodium berghei]VUC57175.1 adenylyl cyclase beta, putative [Plasmodium berghei ANKA]|eukprot:XP_034422954.1 adenylyl cyclase beta, putative [Plasmodium berghei ANKA]
MIKNIFNEYLKHYDNKNLGYEENDTNIPSKEYYNEYISDWRWFSIKCERIIESELNKKHLQKNEKNEYKNNITEIDNISTFRSFFPKILLNAYSRYSNPKKFFDNLIIQKFNAVVFFCDASGFSSLAEQLDKKINGAELLGNCLNKFFNILIKIIDSWGGDIIKFSGDAVMVIWPLNVKMKKKIPKKKKETKLVVKENIEIESQNNEKKDRKKNEINNTNENKNIDEIKINKIRRISLLALGCCMNIHKFLNKFPTPIENKYLKVHIVITYGKVNFLQVGNILNKRDYILSGKPLEEIGFGESLAKDGETVISYSFYKNIKDKIEIKETCKKKFYLLIRMKEELDINKLKENNYEKDENIQKNNENLKKINNDKKNINVCKNFDLLLKSFIPDIVYRKLSIGYNIFFNETRKVTVIFVSVKDVDTSTMTGIYSTHSIMKLTQKAVFTMEGTINKFIFDDKGILILIMFGLPPLYHSDDSIRALLTCFRLIDGLKSLKLNGSIGVSTGKIWCGIVGNKIRKEYTALGDSVNIAARLCCKAGNKEIYVDENTYNNCKHFIIFQSLISIKVKGKNKLIKIYSPIGTINKRENNIDYNDLFILDYFTDKELLNNEIVDSLDSDKEIEYDKKKNTKKLLNNYEEITDFNFVNKNFLLIYYKNKFKDRINDLLNRKDCLHYLKTNKETQKNSYQNHKNIYYEKNCICNNTLNTNCFKCNQIYSLSPYYFLKIELYTDYKTHTGPLFIHEYYDPLFFDFKEIYNVGGVLFLEGNEHLGIFELIKLIKKSLNNFKIFNISNMPNSLYINITNPLLPWKILCNDITNMWKLCNTRKKYLYFNKVDNYNILKEITHPSYHWFLKCMSNIIDDLYIPDTSMKKETKNINKIFDTQKINNIAHIEALNGSHYDENRKNGRAFCNKLVKNMRKFFFNSTLEIRNDNQYESRSNTLSNNTSGVINKKKKKKLKGTQNENSDNSILYSSYEEEEEEEYINMKNVNMTNINSDYILKNDMKENRISIINCMIYNFSLYEHTFIVFNYRSGTSLNISIEEHAWRICKNISKLAIYKRNKIVKNFHKNLKNWRKNHCRMCNFCKGVGEINFVNFSQIDDNDNGISSNSSYFDLSNCHGQISENITNKMNHISNEENMLFNKQTENTILKNEEKDKIYSNSSKNTIIAEKKNNNISINLLKDENDKNIFQMFKEQKLVNENKKTTTFYKTIYPNIQDNILLYIAQQKAKQETVKKEYDMQTKKYAELTKINNINSNHIKQNENIFNFYKSRQSNLCNPIFKPKNKPLIFLFVNGAKNNDNVKDLKKMKKYAKECNGYIKLENFDKNDLYNFVSLCLNVNVDKISEELINYLNKICFGFPKFVQYTLFYLLKNKYIKLYKYNTPNVLEKTNEQLHNTVGLSTNVYEYTDIEKRNFVSKKNSNSNNNFSSFKKNEQNFTKSSKTPRNFISYYYINKASQNIIREQNKFLNFTLYRETNNTSINSDYSNYDPKTEKNKNENNKSENLYKFEMEVVKDLDNAALVPRLIAYCMFMIDSLSEEDQLLAKLCSFFKDKFNIKKMECIYPKPLSRSELKKIIVNLVKKNVFQVCDDNNKKSNTTPKENNVNSIHNINFIYRHVYNKVDSISANRKPIHLIFSTKSDIPEENIFFRIANYALKKVLNELMENEEKKYIQTIYKKYIED